MAKTHQVCYQHRFGRMSWTRVVQAYPASLCVKVAAAIARKAAWPAQQPLAAPPYVHRASHSTVPLASAIAKQSCGCWGEALKPGRRARVPPTRVTGLEEQPLLSQATLQLGNRCWESFLVWSATRLSFDLSESFGRSPCLACHGPARVW